MDRYIVVKQYVTKKPEKVKKPYKLKTLIVLVVIFSLLLIGLFVYNNYFRVYQVSFINASTNEVLATENVKANERVKTPFPKIKGATYWAYKEGDELKGWTGSEIIKGDLEILVTIDN